LTDRKMIYTGSAVADLDGKTVQLTVYRTGKLSYELQCTGRPKDVYLPKTLIDAKMLKARFASEYKLSKIQLELLSTKTEGQR
jgi:hypothetical protein